MSKIQLRSMSTPKLEKAHTDGAAQRLVYLAYYDNGNPATRPVSRPISQTWNADGVPVWSYGDPTKMQDQIGKDVDGKIGHANLDSPVFTAIRGNKVQLTNVSYVVFDGEDENLICTRAKANAVRRAAQQLAAFEGRTQSVPQTANTPDVDA